MNEPKSSADDPADHSPDYEGTERPARGGDLERSKSVRKRRIEPPVLVIEPDKSSFTSPPREKAGGASVAQNLEGMVHDLLNKVRQAESRLQEKEEAISLLQDQTVTLARKLLLSSQGPSKDPSEKSAAGQDRVGLEALDFFTRAFRPEASAPSPAAPPAPAVAAPAAPPVGVKGAGAEKAARAPREPKGSRARAPAAAVHAQPASAVGRACPACGHHLRKARCLNVQILVCLSCRGLHLDARAIRQLARLLPWMHYVQQFLSSASRGLPEPQKPAKGSSSQKSSGHSDRRA